MSDSLIEEMRKQGEEFDDKGLFEFDLITGQVRWANSFALNLMGYTSEQLESMTVFDLVPIQLHERMREGIADRVAGRSPRTSILPIKSADGDVVWWYVFKTKIKSSISWSHSEYIQKTEPKGMAFAFMRMQMDSINYQYEVESKMDELDSWVHSQIDRIDNEVVDIKETITLFSDKIEHAINAAKNASSTSLDTKNGISTLIDKFDDLEREMYDHTSEILRLIKTDVEHDTKFEAFEKHIKMTTDLAIQSIAMQADKAGKGLSKKVTVPVSAIAVIATLIQYVIQNWDDISKFLHF
jgi:PAS domain S-box-containing protein